MTQKTIHMFIFTQTKSIPNYPKRHIAQTKLMCIILLIFGVLDDFDLKDYGPEIKRGYGKSLVVIDSFSKFG